MSKSKQKHKNSCGRYRMVVGFRTTYAISAYHHQSRELKSRSRQGVIETTLYDKIRQ